MTRQSILLIFGGESSEHDVSIMSARNVYAALDGEKYDVLLCYIDQNGKWWLLDEWRENLDNHGGRQLLAALGTRSFLTMPGSEVVRADVAFPLLHGKYGEDGTVQGLLELLHIPFVGPSVLAAAVTMDKDMTKRLAKEAGVPVVPWILWDTHQEMPEYDAVIQELGEIVFVKPSRAGSSMGVSKVDSRENWQAACNLAARHDTQVLIEAAMPGNEFQVAVLGNEQIDVTDVCEIVIGESFHDFKDKYDEHSAAQFFIPARLDQIATGTVLKAAKTVYEATRCKGMARVDFLAGNDGLFYLNEVNSIPGFTSVSIYPRLWHSSGTHYPDLVNRLISLVLEK